MADQTRDANVRLTADVDPYTQQIKAAETETTRLAAAVDKLGTKLDGITKRAGKKLLLFGAGGAAGMATLTAEAADFEKKLSTLNATGAVTGKSMEGATKQIRALTREFPISRDASVELVTSLEKLGVASNKNLRIVSESMVKLSQATGEGLPALTQEMVGLQRQMGTLNTGTMDVFANSLLKTADSAGVGASNVLQFASAIAPAARAADMSQASVLGVATAFTKAGADGFAAASTFNSMLNDITRQVVTGSPEIAKYSNLIGVSADQFAKMDKGQAVAAIFETISNQGPDAIKTLDRLGFDGVRAMKSIQAVSQGGGMQKAIAEATGAYQTTSSLEGGSGAATKGLYDQLARTKNMMVDVSTQAGEPLLIFFTQLATAVNSVIAPLTNVTDGLASFAAAVGGLGALSTLAMGGAMALGGIKMAVATAGFVGNAGPRSAMRAGAAFGRNMVGGPDLVGRNADIAERYQRGDLRYWNRGAFIAGANYGGVMGPGTPGGVGALSRATAGLIRGTGFLGGAIMQGQAQFYQTAATPGMQRGGGILGGLGTTGGTLRGAYRAFRDDRAGFIQGFRTGPTGDIGESFQKIRRNLAEEIKTHGGALPPDTMAALNRQAAAAATALTRTTVAANANVGAMRQLGLTSGMLTKEFIKLQMAGVGATAKIAGQGLVAGGKAAGAGLAGMLGVSPYGAAAIGAGAIGYAAYSSRNMGNAEIGESAPIDKYNAALGIATTELGSFADAVTSATKSLPVPLNMSATSQITPEVSELARMPKRELTNDIFGNLKSKESRAAMMQLMRITDPRQMQLVQADLVQSQGTRRAQAATDVYFQRTEAGKGVDYRALAKDVLGEQRQGVRENLFGRADPTGAKIYGAAFESLLGQRGTDTKMYNAAYADQRQVNEIGKLIGAAIPRGDATKDFTGLDSSKARVATTAVKEFENAVLGGTRTGFNASDFAQQTQGMSDKEQGEYFYKEFLGKNKNKRVRNIISDLEDQGIDFGGMSMAGMANLKKSQESPYRAGILAAGDIGKFALAETRTSQYGIKEKGGVVQEAVKFPEDVRRQYEAITELGDKAQKLGGSFSGADAQLQLLKAGSKDVTDQLYILANAAQELKQKEALETRPGLGRVGRMEQSAEAYRAVLREDKETPGYDERLNAKRDAYIADKAATEDYMRSVIAAQKNFAVQQQRAQKDYDISIRQGNKDFHIAMKQSEDDYLRSRANSQRDFNMGMEHQQEDFNISMRRGQEDLHRSLTRASEDLAASIHDPFARIEQQFTTSSGTMMQNLRDQNEEIEGQNKNLEKVHKLGLSQKSIDVLGLADPAKARQLERLVDDLNADPSQVKGINKLAARRGKATEELTTNPLSKQYRRTMEDYHRGVNQATTDFEKSQARANEANAIMLQDMATNFGIMTDRATAAHNRGLDRMADAFERNQNRAKKDLARMSEEILGDFASLYTQAVNLVGTNLGKFGNKVIAELEKFKKKFPEVFASMYGKEAQTLPPADYFQPGSAASQLQNQPPSGLVGGHSSGSGGSGGGGGKKGGGGGNVYVAPRGVPVEQMAWGGIVTTPFTGMVGEGGPEAVIPLNSQGISFMSSMFGEISRSMLKDSQTISSPVSYKGMGGITKIDASTHFDGPVYVEATDPDQMAKKLAEKARVKKLTRPSVAGTA